MGCPMGPHSNPSPSIFNPSFLDPLVDFKLIHKPCVEPINAIILGGWRGSVLWKLAFMAINWIIWKGRNYRCYEDELSNLIRPLVDKMRITVTSWTVPLSQFRNIPLDTNLQNWKEGPFSSLMLVCINRRWISDRCVEAKLQWCCGWESTVGWVWWFTM